MWNEDKNLKPTRLGLAHTARVRQLGARGAGRFPSLPFESDFFFPIPCTRQYSDHH